MMKLSWALDSRFSIPSFLILTFCYASLTPEARSYSPLDGYSSEVYAYDWIHRIFFQTMPK